MILHLTGLSGIPEAAGRELPAVEPGGEHRPARDGGTEAAS